MKTTVLTLALAAALWACGQPEAAIMVLGTMLAFGVALLLAGLAVFALAIWCDARKKPATPRE
ncbi:MAG: hypothetical protein LCH38_10975 [Proteobacteria bacterium]|nr:hypothetical protein [Pseudomonadota bacterium]